MTHETGNNNEGLGKHGCEECRFVLEVSAMNKRNGWRFFVVVDFVGTEADAQDRLILDRIVLSKN